MKRYFALAFALIGTSTSLAADQKPVDNRPASKEDLKTVIRYLKQTMSRVDGIEKRSKDPGKATPKGAEETVDLNTIATESAPGAPPIGAATSDKGGHSKYGATGVAPTFKTYFDLDLVLQPGIQDLTFTNYHSLLFFEIIPSPDIQFTFDVNPSPRFFELDYQITKNLQVRVGKIWIPFDDMSPHNIFGGRVNVSRLAAPSANPYLPDIWTDYGVGIKYHLVDSMALSLLAHAYVVNGFQDNGVDPANPGSPYPSFSDAAVRDNNRNKALGGRLHAIFNNKYGVGGSVYWGRWSPQSIDAQSVLMLGLDTQIRLTPVELRFGYSKMNVGIPGDSFTRGGLYIEAGYKFGPNQAWKILGRAGEIQLDNRVAAITDQRLVGATLLWKPGLIEYSIEHSRDLKTVIGKTNYSYSAARIIMAF